MSDSNSNSNANNKLQRITEIELLGKKFDLAKNGGFKLCLVENDAYGNPRATELDLMELANLIQVNELEEGLRLASATLKGKKVEPRNVQKEVMQALLNLAGDAIVRSQFHRDSRLGTGNQED